MGVINDQALSDALLERSSELAAGGGELDRDFAYGLVRQLLERPVIGAVPEARAGDPGRPS